LDARPGPADLARDFLMDDSAAAAPEACGLFLQ